MQRLSGRDNLKESRGSALLLVLALLSILVLLAATLTFTSRLEVLSSSYFGRGVQLETAILTGVDDAGLELSTIVREQRTLGPLDLKLNKDLRQRIQSGESIRSRRLPEGKELEDLLIHRTNFVEVDVQDASGLVNLNTAPAGQIVSVLSILANRAKFQDRRIDFDPGLIANGIHSFRLGPDAAPGIRGYDDNRNGKHALPLPNGEELDLEAPVEQIQRQIDEALKLRRRYRGDPVSTERPESQYDVVTVEFVNRQPPPEHLLDFYLALYAGIDEPEEYISDIRYPPFGDDRRFHSVYDLLEIPGINDELMQLAAPYFTVFSMSEVTRSAAHGYAPLVDLNRASYEEILDALVKEYGDSKEYRVMQQYAANLVDARDIDSQPTVDGDVFGWENTPFITEVHPDSKTPDNRGDDGQFLEIYNPWHFSFDLSGWSVRVNGMSYPLAGKLRHNGFLIVTDDYDNALDPYAEEDPKGTGSFYDLFKAVHGREDRRIAEFSSFDLPHTPGTHFVELFDNEGALIDRFAYQVGTEPITGRSYSRTAYLFDREVESDWPTPFRHKGIENIKREDSRLSLRSGYFTPNLPFHFWHSQPVASYVSGHSHWFMVPYGISGDLDSRSTSYYATPAFVSPDSRTEKDRELVERRDVIDGRILNIFTIEGVDRTKALELPDEHQIIGRGLGEKSFLDPWNDRLEALDTPEERAREAEALAGYRMSPPHPTLYQGMININTAPEHILRDVLGYNDEKVAEILRLRKEREQAIMDGEALPAGVFSRRSESPRGSGSRYVATGIAFNSRSFFLEGRALEESDSNEPKTTAKRSLALIALDREDPEIVSWSTTP